MHILPDIFLKKEMSPFNEINVVTSQNHVFRISFKRVKLRHISTSTGSGLKIFKDMKCLQLCTP
jgi:hypothetical protein